MAKILNLIIQDRDGFKDPKTFVESFEIREDVREPEKALHDAVKEFISSGSSE